MTICIYTRMEKKKIIFTMLAIHVDHFAHLRTFFLLKHLLFMHLSNLLLIFTSSNYFCTSRICHCYGYFFCQLLAIWKERKAKQSMCFDYISMSAIHNLWMLINYVFWLHKLTIYFYYIILFCLSQELTN